MGTDLEIQIEKMEISESGLVLKQVNKLKFHYDKYNPICGGSFIELPDWVKKKKHVSTSKTKTTNALSMQFNVEYIKFTKKTTPVSLIITKL